MAIQLPTDVCYGSMAFFMAILHNIFLLYHVDMFVSVYKIDKFSFWVGEAIFLLWNSFNDPLFGWLSDRHYLSNSGKPVSQREIVMKRFNALQTNGPFFAISFLAFWIPWAYPWLQFVVCLCLYDGFLTMLDLHHSALLADLSVSADIRTNLNSKCSVFSAFGSASVFLSYAFWNKDDLFTFRIFCCVLAVMSFVGFMASSNLLKNYYVAKHKEEPVPVPVQSSTEPVQSSPTKSFMSQLLSQRNFFWFAAMNLIQVFHCHFNSNFFPLFLENLLGDSISPGFGSFLLGISFVAPHINNLYFLRLCRRYGVYKVIHILFLVKLVLSVVMLLGGPSHIWLLCIYIASNRVFTEGTCKLLNLVISDLVDEDYVLHSRRQPVSALMFGTAALVSKPGQTLAPLIGTWILSMQTGHDIFQSGKDVGSIKMNYQHMDATTREAHRQGCFNLLVYIPIICAVAQSLVWMQFSLHGHRLARVKALRQGEYADHV